MQFSQFVNLIHNNYWFSSSNSMFHFWQISLSVLCLSVFNSLVDHIQKLIRYSVCFKLLSFFCQIIFKLIAETWSVDVRQQYRLLVLTSYDSHICWYDFEQTLEKLLFLELFLRLHLIKLSISQLIFSVLRWMMSFFQLTSFKTCIQKVLLNSALVNNILSQLSHYWIIRSQ